MTQTRDTTPARLDLPADFAWGVATAAYQIEGAVAEGVAFRASGTRSFASPAGSFHGEDGDVAVDHYHRWAEDLDLMAELVIPAYRLSLSWARLQPTGRWRAQPRGRRVLPRAPRAAGPAASSRT